MFCTAVLLLGECFHLFGLKPVCMRLLCGDVHIQGIELESDAKHKTGWGKKEAGRGADRGLKMRYFVLYVALGVLASTCDAFSPSFPGSFRASLVAPPMRPGRVCPARGSRTPSTLTLQSSGAYGTPLAYTCAFDHRGAVVELTLLPRAAKSDPWGGRIGSMTTKEFSDGYEVLQDVFASLPRQSGYQTWKGLFSKIDEDSSGMLDQKEMTRALKQIAGSIKDEHVALVMKTLDADGDGEVSYKVGRDVGQGGAVVQSCSVRYARLLSSCEIQSVRNSARSMGDPSLNHVCIFPGVFQRARAC